MRVLGLIPARGGSKGVPRKNLKPLAGRPLIAHTIEVAYNASLDRVIVSTEDQEIADVARLYGAAVPFLRPSSLAQDNTPDLPVFEHALEWLEKHESYRPDIIVHLRPTTPFRTASDIDAAVRLLQCHPEADSVRSVSPPRENPFKMWRIDAGCLHPLLGTMAEELFNQPRQQLPHVYWQNGCLDVTRYETIVKQRSMTGRTVLPYIMAGRPMVDLDSLDDFERAEHLLKAGA